MASTIITKNSSTASAVPVVGDLTKGELAVNVTDKKIYTKDNSAAVVKLVGSLGNQEANAVAITGGSIAGITDLAVADGGTGASTASDARTNLGLGTIATQAASSVTITGGSVTGITDITVADGGTGASTAANARTNLGAAASGANSDITSLSGLTTALSVAQGGTGITSFGSGVATFLGTPSSANLLAAVTDETGTGSLVFANTPTLVAPILGTPTSGNFSTGTFTWPTFNQNTTGTAAGLSATLAIASGGTGATTAGGALTSLGAYAASNPSGYTSNTGTVTSVGGTGTVNGLTLTGTVTTSGNLTLGGTLSGVSLTSQVSGTLPTANGGTNLTSFTSGGVVYASSTSALATGSALTFDGTNLGVGITPTTKLHVSSASNTFATVESTNGAAYWQMIGNNSTNASYNSLISKYGATTDWSISGGNGTTGQMLFNIGGTEGFRLTSTSLYTASGINVGIGTSSPNSKLEVSGNVGSGVVTAGVTNSDASGFSTLRLRNTGASGRDYQVVVGGNTSGQNGNFYIFDTTASAVRFTISPDGNAGLGVTPSAWNTIKPIEIARAGSFVGANSSGSTYLGANTRFASGWIYANTGASGLYTVEDNTHFWRIAPSGTAGNAISFTQAMTLDASGNLGVGTTSPSARFSATITAAQNTNTQVFTATDSTYCDFNVYLNRVTTLATSSAVIDTSAGILALKTTNTERARIDSSGNLLVGTTNSAPGSANVSGFAVGSSGYISASRTNVAAEFNLIGLDGDTVVFRRSGTQVGSVSVTTTATAYNTTSDYRLKTVIGPVANAGQRIDALQPVEYTWNASGERTRGFLAHQFAEVYAGSVSGTKDAVDAEGKPKYQAMQASTSEVIADLVAEIQSLRQRLSAANL